MPYKPVYTPEEIFRFKQKDKKIMFQSVFSSLCELTIAHRKELFPEKCDGLDLISYITERTTKLVEWLSNTAYPDEEPEKTPELKGEELDKELERTKNKLRVLEKQKGGEPF